MKWNVGKKNKKEDCDHRIIYSARKMPLGLILRADVETDILPPKILLHR
jgi:hypothetical protein